MKKIILLCYLLLVAYACSKTTAGAALSDDKLAKKANITLAQFQEGKQIYSTKCGKCHTLYEPTGLTKEKWEKMLPPMYKKARLAPEQSDLVGKYIWAARAGK